MEGTLSQCRLCPRRCGVDRLQGGIGRCGEDSRIRIGRASLHRWEEPCISGVNGSGTVFFSGCALGCVFCQNSVLSRPKGAGRYVDIDGLQRIYASLKDQGAHNINLVTPSHYTPQIALSLDKDPGLPVVWNSSAYELPSTLDMLKGKVRIFLPDLKYFDPDIAEKYSSAGDYPEIAKRAIEKMVELAGPPRFDCDGMMVSGVIVRHLVLPSHSSDSKRIVEYLYKTYGDSIYISIMSQYTPMPSVKYPELKRKLRQREYEAVTDYALALGLTNGFFQEGEAASESFIPEFNGEGVDI